MERNTITQPPPHRSRSLPTGRYLCVEPFGGINGVIRLVCYRCFFASYENPPHRCQVSLSEPRQVDIKSSGGSDSSDLDLCIVASGFVRLPAISVGITRFSPKPEPLRRLLCSYSDLSRTSEG